MKAYDFYYDGLNLSDKGFIICKFDSDGINISSNGSHITFNTVQTMNGIKHELVGSKYNDYLTATFQICKHPCRGNDSEISIEESRDIMKWLNRKEFHKFRILNSDYINIFFEATFNVSKIEYNGSICGFELEVITNRPFAVHEPIPITINRTSEEKKIEIYSQSDEEGYIYPDMEIRIEEDGDFKLYNDLEDRTMIINNCKSGEVITIKYPIIYSSFEEHKIQNDFNWRFFRIANTYRNHINKLTISIPCVIKLSYSPIIKVGI